MKKNIKKKMTRIRREKSNIGMQILNARLKAGLSHEGLAKRLKVSPKTLSNYLSGESPPPDHRLKKIAQICGIAESFLIAIKNSEKVDRFPGNKGVAYDISKIKTGDKLMDKQIAGLADLLIKIRAADETKFYDISAKIFFAFTEVDTKRGRKTDEGGA